MKKCVVDIYDIFWLGGCLGWVVAPWIRVPVNVSNGVIRRMAYLDANFHKPKKHIN